MKLGIKQRLKGAVNVYEVKLTVHIHHQSEAEAQSYLTTALREWARNGEIIAGVEFNAIEESPKRFFVPNVMYPEYSE
jgi:hypothetical protein